MTTDQTTLTEESVLEALRQVEDPEIGCNIVDLGLIYGVQINGGTVAVQMTLTTQGCPMHESLTWGTRMAVQNLPGVEEVEVDLVWDPPWTPAMLTEKGRQITGFA